MSIYSQQHVMIPVIQVIRPRQVCLLVLEFQVSQDRPGNVQQMTTDALVSENDGGAATNKLSGYLFFSTTLKTILCL